MPLASRFPLGMEAAEVVAGLVAERPEIAAVSLCAFQPAADVAERMSAVLGPGGGWLGEILQRLRADDEPGGVLAAIIARAAHGGDAAALVGQALRHDKADYREVEIRRDQVTPAAVRKFQEEVGAGFVVGLKSTVRVEGTDVRHVPMMDFSCVPSPAGLAFVTTALRQIDRRRGIVLASGRSYHFYGLDLLSEPEWRRFLGRCLLLAPPVDARYVAHRLIDGYGVLRLSANARKPRVPSVAAVLDDPRGAP